MSVGFSLSIWSTSEKSCELVVIFMDRNEVFIWAANTYGTTPDYPWNDNNAVLRHKGSGKWYGVVLKVSERKLGIDGDRTIDLLNLKCDPILIGSLRLQKGFFPAYHMNKDRWISILLDGTVTAEEIKSLMEMSFNLTI